MQADTGDKVSRDTSNPDTEKDKLHNIYKDLHRER